MGQSKMNEDNFNFNEAIDILGWKTQVQAAEKLGVAQPTISIWANGAFVPVPVRKLMLKMIEEKAA